MHNSPIVDGLPSASTMTRLRPGKPRPIDTNRLSTSSAPVGCRQDVTVVSVGP